MGSSCAKRPVVLENNKSNNLKLIGNNKDEKSNNLNFNKSTKNILSNKCLYKNNNENIVDINKKYTNNKLITSMANECNFSSTVVEFQKGNLIGKGTIGSAYSALSFDTGNIMVVKVIDFSKLKQEDKITNILKSKLNLLECIDNSSTLDCMYINKYVTSYETIENENEYCTGGSIQELLNKFGSFEENLIRKYVKQTLIGLKYLHEKDIIHYNIKPSNILIDSNGIIKITDYLELNSLTVRNTEYMTKIITDNYKNPPYLMSPEVANNSAKLTTAIDIWALGCLIITMANNSYPWYDTCLNYSEVINKIKDFTVPPKFPSNLSLDAKDFLKNIFKKQPENRMTASQLLLHSWMKRESIIHKTDCNFNVINKNSNSNTKQNTNNLRKSPILKNIEGKFSQIKIVSDNIVNLADKKKLINILNDNPNNSGEFSISVSVSDDQDYLNNCSNILNSLKYNIDINNIHNFDYSKDKEIYKHIHENNANKYNSTFAINNSVEKATNNITINNKDIVILKKSNEYNNNLPLKKTSNNYLYNNNTNNIDPKTEKHLNDLKTTLLSNKSSNSNNIIFNNIENNNNNNNNKLEFKKENFCDDECIIEEINERTLDKKSSLVNKNTVIYGQTLDLKDDLINFNKNANNIFSIDDEEEKLRELLNSKTKL